MLLLRAPLAARCGHGAGASMGVGSVSPFTAAVHAPRAPRRSVAAAAKSQGQRPPKPTPRREANAAEGGEGIDIDAFLKDPEAVAALRCALL